MSYSSQGLLNSIKKLSEALVGVPIQAFNAKLSFFAMSGTVTTDSWGNPTLGTSTLVELQAKLMEVKPSSTQENPGIDSSLFYYEGYLVSPLIYSLPLPKKIQAELLYHSTWRKGDFFPINKFISPLSEAIEVSSTLGQKIAGYFQLLEGN